MVDLAVLVNGTTVHIGAGTESIVDRMVHIGVLSHKIWAVTESKIAHMVHIGAVSRSLMDCTVHIWTFFQDVYGPYGPSNIFT